RRTDAPRQVAQLGVLFLLRGDGARLEGHAADRAAPRPVAHDLGVHRTGPQRASRSYGRGRRQTPDEAFGFGDEPLAASRAAEDILAAGMVGAVTRGRRVDAHAAY